VYILTSKKNGTLYIGVTSDLHIRIAQHKNKKFDGFTSEYNINILVYYEIYSDILDAIKREKNIKEWRRSWKLNLIEKDNPQWKELPIPEFF